MLRLCTALLALLPMLALGGQFRPTDVRTCRLGGRSRMCQSVGQAGGGGTPPALFTLLPPNGNGAPVMDPSGVCDAFASELVGSYVCMRGDGTSVNAPGVTLTPVGTVTTTTPRICPNGTDCAPVAAQSFDDADARWLSNVIAAPAGDFTLCVATRVRAEGTTLAPIGISSNTFITSTLAAINNTLRLNTGATFTPNATTPAAGSWNFLCGTYQRVGGATNNIGATYVNGQAIGSSSALALPAGTQVRIGNDVASPGRHDIALALYTEKVLSPATIAAMSQKVFGTFTAADMVTATGYTRTSVASCKGPDGRLTVLPSLRPCIWRPNGFTGPALEVENGRTNAIIRSQELDTWTSAGATAAANQATAPDSTLTAERLTDDATTGEHMVSRAVTLAQVPTAASAFFRAGTKTIGVLKYSTTHYAFVDLATGAATFTGPAGPTVLAEQFANGWWRLVLLLPNANAVTNPTVAIGLANAAGSPSYAGDGAGTIEAWGVQVEGSNPGQPLNGTSYMRSDGSVVTRIKSFLEATYPPGMSNTTGCLGFRAGPSTVTLGGTQPWNTTAGADNSGFSFASDTTVACNDGANNPAVVVPSILTTPPKWACSWAGAVLTTRTASAAENTAAYDGTMLGASYTIGAKATTGSSALRGFVGEIKFGDKTNACR